MNVLSIPHDPTPLVLLQVYLPYGTAIGEASHTGWRDAAWTTFAGAADERLRAAVQKLMTIVPYSDLVVTRDVTDSADVTHPTSDPKVQDESLLRRTDGVPCIAVATRNGDEYDPFPFVLAWATAVAIGTHEGGVVYAPRQGRLWDPRTVPMPKLAGALCVRDFLTFEASGDEHGSFAASTGLPCFGIPDLSWDAPAGTDAEMMRNLLVCATSALMRARRSAGRKNPGQATLDVPAMFPLLFGDLAAAWGLSVDALDPSPETQLASVPLDVSTDHTLAIKTNASAAALNEWLAGIRENVARVRMPAS